MVHRMQGSKHALSKGDPCSMATPAPSSNAVPATPLLPILALVLGAIAMGASPLFVRLADIGPITSAFYRVGLAVPVLVGWALIEARRSGATLSWQVLSKHDKGTRFAILAGLVFAGDLLFWHLAIMNTSVANATFFAAMAPVWVLLPEPGYLPVFGVPPTREATPQRYKDHPGMQANDRV